MLLMIFNALLELLSSPSGVLITHVMVFLGFFTTAGLVWTEWRHARSSELQPQWIALAAVMLTRFADVLLASLYPNTDSLLAIVAGPWIYASEALTIFLLAWALNRRIVGRSRRSSLILAAGLGAWALLLLVMTGLWYGRAMGRDLIYHLDSWQSVVWYAVAALASFAGGGLLVSRESGFRTSAPYVFFLLGIGSGLGALASPSLGPAVAGGEAWARIGYLVGYPLFAIALYSSVLDEITTYREELRSLSYQALTQTQELLSLIETTGLLGRGNTELREMLDKVLTNVAMALGADAALILLPHREMRGIMRIAARYQVLNRKGRTAKEIKLDDYPEISKGLRSESQLVLGRMEEEKRLENLSTLLGGHAIHTVLIQPLMHQSRCLGVLVASLEENRRAFVEERRQFSTTIGAQIAGAIENVRLYRTVESKARELERLLSRREAELRRESAILESMSEGVLVTDAEGSFVMMNRAAEEILGVDRQEFLERTFQDVMDEYTSSGAISPGALMSLADTYESLFTIEDRYIRVHAAPVLMDNGISQGVVSVLQDITGEQLAEKAKREFIASISHELRTPLTAIKGYADVMLSGMAGDVPSVFLQFLRSIRDNTTRMTTLTNNIISIAEIERGTLGLNYQTVDLGDLLRASARRYEERSEEQQKTMTVLIDPKLPEIEADPNRMRIIIDNLVNNAIKFTHDGGEITIGAAPIDGAMKQPVFITFWVKDNGVGIPVEEQVRIWERFYRVEHALSFTAGGLGIGLTITKALTEAHGGRVWVDSEPGEGSTFAVLMPIKRGREMDSRALNELIQQSREAETGPESFNGLSLDDPEAL
jgi:PAS domain S-box-containing protein